MTKFARVCLAFVVLAAGTVRTLAEEPTPAQAEAAQAAVKNMAREILECAAYFDIVSLVLLDSNERATSNQYIEARKLAVARADSLSPGISNAQYNDIIKELTKKVAMANVPRAIDETLVHVSITDIAVLQNQYGRLCKEVLNSPGDRSKYWMDRAKSSP
jgi:hypothetical protein